MNTVLGRAAILMAFLLGAAAAMYSQQGATQTQRIAQFENEDVKVWKSVILPNAPLTMHRHEHPRVIVALSGGTMNIVEQDGPTEQHVLGDGQSVLAASESGGDGPC
jgi:hypothetical protein